MLRLSRTKPMRSRQEAAQPPFCKSHQNWLPPNPTFGDLSSNLQPSIEQPEILELQFLYLTTPASGSGGGSCAIERDFPRIILLRRVDQSRQLVVACSLSNLAFFLTKRPVVHRQIALPAPRVHHDAAEQLQFVIDCPGGNRALHGGAHLFASFLLV